jgi:hypothetical protein
MGLWIPIVLHFAASIQAIFSSRPRVLTHFINTNMEQKELHETAVDHGNAACHLEVTVNGHGGEVLETKYAGQFHRH